MGECKAFAVCKSKTIPIQESSRSREDTDQQRATDSWKEEKAAGEDFEIEDT